MSIDDAWALSRLINERQGRFLAGPYDVGSFALVLLQDKQDGPSRSPIVDAARYLDLMERGSTAVESDTDLHDALREWLMRTTTGTTGNPADRVGPVDAMDPGELLNPRR
jgi:hypothetical protein